MLGQSEWPSFLDWVPNGFDSWEAWVAIGTLALASATAFLGLQAKREASAVRDEVKAATEATEATRASAEAARRSAEVSERAFAAGIRPMLTQSDQNPPLVERGQNVVTARVHVRNVGSGLALIQGLGWVGAPANTTIAVTTSGAAVPVAERTWLIFEVTCADEAAALDLEKRLHEAPGLTVFVRYADMTGGQLTRTRVRLVYGAETGWRFEEVTVFDDEAEQPFAVLLGRGVTVAPRAAVRGEYEPTTP